MGIPYAVFKAEHTASSSTFEPRSYPDPARTAPQIFAYAFFLRMNTPPTTPISTPLHTLWCQNRPLFARSVPATTNCTVWCWSWLRYCQPFGRKVEKGRPSRRFHWMSMRDWLHSNNFSALFSLLLDELVTRWNFFHIIFSLRVTFGDANATKPNARTGEMKKLVFLLQYHGKSASRSESNENVVRFDLKLKSIYCDFWHLAHFASKNVLQLVLEKNKCIFGASS